MNRHHPRSFDRNLFQFGLIVLKKMREYQSTTRWIKSKQTNLLHLASIFHQYFNKNITNKLRNMPIKPDLKAVVTASSHVRHAANTVSEISLSHRYIALMPIFSRFFCEIDYQSLVSCQIRPTQYISMKYRQ